MQKNDLLERCINNEVVCCTSGGDNGFVWLIELKDDSYFLELDKIIRINNYFQMVEEKFYTEE